MPNEIDRHGVQRLIAEGARIVDVLPEKEYARSHIEGAVSIPLGDLRERAAEVLDARRPVVVYCYDSLCDLSPRAAARLESLGFADVHDYVASKVDWLGAGLPFEGTLADEPRLGTLADRDVPTCGVAATAGEVRDRVDDGGACVIVDDRGVVLGLAHADDLSTDAARAVIEVMDAAPRTHRPHVTAEEFAPRLERDGDRPILVTRLDGTLVGIARPDDIRGAAGAAAS